MYVEKVSNFRQDYDGISQGHHCQSDCLSQPDQTSVLRPNSTAAFISSTNTNFTIIVTWPAHSLSTSAAQNVLHELAFSRA